MVRKILCLALVSLVGVIGVQAPASATTTTVTNGNDSGPGSLRAALADASDGDVITFATGVTTVTLTSGRLDITKGVTISGTASAIVTVTRSATAATNFPIFVITPTQNTTVTLDYLDISNGTEGGVGINSTGGSVVRIKHSSIRDNTRAWGAGIYAINGAGGPGSLIVDSTTISGNITNGGTSCGFCNGAGGIIEIPTIFVNSTIAYNQSGDNGGGIKVDSNVQFYNSTIAYNSAHGLGAGIWESQYNNSPVLTMMNTIIAKNTIGTATGAAQCNTTKGNDSYVVAINKNNLIEDDSCNYIRTALNAATSPATNFLSGDPLLGTFGVTGGTNKVFPLSTGSLAIGAGDHEICTGGFVAGVDQQGTARGTNCSIGAIEFHGASSNSGSTQNPPVVAKKITITFTVGKSGLTATMRKSLKNAASSLSKTQKLTVTVSSTKAPSQTVSEGQKLAQKREKNIRDYLVSIGLAKSRVTVKFKTI